MEDVFFEIFLLTLLALAGFFLRAIFKILKLTINTIKISLLGVGKEQKYLLEKYSHYYQKLCPEDKKHFEYRVKQFIDDMDFVPREIEKVTVKMTTIIAATAIQLSFGLDKYKFRHFSKF